MRRLLIVGFGPFPGVPVNPSGLLAARIVGLPRWRRLGIDPRLLVMRTAYDAIPAELDPALAEGPDAVLMIGVATRTKRVQAESRAHNRASRLFPDAAGRRSERFTLDADGPAARASVWAERSLVQLRRCGLDAGLSRDAGRYLCNATYYRVLAEHRPAVFLHIPLSRTGRRRNGSRRRSRPTEIWTTAFAEVAVGLVGRSRGRGASLG